MKFQNIIDMHTHSDNSFDGNHSVILLCESAFNKKAKAIAITDHCEIDSKTMDFRALTINSFVVSGAHVGAGFVVVPHSYVNAVSITDQGIVLQYLTKTNNAGQFPHLTYLFRGRVENLPFPRHDLQLRIKIAEERRDQIVETIIDRQGAY